MHLTIETQAAYAEGTISAAESRKVHAHLLLCASCTAGIADQMAVRNALRNLPVPEPATDGWPALAAALDSDWRSRPLQAGPAPRPRRLPIPRRWAAAALFTVGLAGGILLMGIQPAPAEDELDSFWREHHTFNARNTVSGRHLSSYRSILTTHRMNQQAK